MTEERSVSDRLKARLTGAVALLLIGIVGWFWLLDSDNPAEPVAQESAIPPAPDIQPFTVPQPTAPTDIKPVGAERDAPVAQEAPTPKPKSEPAKSQPAPAQAVSELKRPEPNATTESTPAPKPVATSPAPKTAPVAEKFAMDTNNLPVAWVVQAGAMGTQASADKLKDDLIAKGFKAFTQRSKLANGNTTFKVYVGPKLSRERADAQKKQIDAALKTNTMVVRFPPA